MSEQEKTALVNELQEYFSGVQLPDEAIRLDHHTLIDSPAKFVEGHLSMATGLRPQYAAPYLDRLLKFKTLLTELYANTGK